MLYESLILTFPIVGSFHPLTHAQFISKAHAARQIESCPLHVHILKREYPGAFIPLGVCLERKNNNKALKGKFCAGHCTWGKWEHCYATQTVPEQNLHHPCTKTTAISCCDTNQLLMRHLLLQFKSYLQLHSWNKCSVLLNTKITVTQLLYIKGRCMYNRGKLVSNTFLSFNFRSYSSLVHSRVS